MTLAVTQQFPMYVLPVREAIKLERLPQHEDVLSKLVVWNEGMGAVLFISQT